MSAVTHEEKNEHNSVLKYPYLCFSANLQRLSWVFWSLAPALGLGEVGRASLSVTNPEPRQVQGGGKSQQDDSGVRGTFGSGCCDACSAGEGQLGHLQDGNKIVGEKEPLCLRKAKPSEIGPPKNG